MQGSNITTKEVKEMLKFMKRKFGENKFQLGTIKSIIKAQKIFSSLFIYEKLQWGENKTSNF